MKSHLNLKEIRSALPGGEPFTRDVIRDFFLKKGELLTEENLKVRINRLKAKDVIISVGRSWYRLNDKKLFEPDLSPILKKLAVKLKKGFPLLNYVLWSSTWLNEMTTLQLYRNVIVVEVESGAQEAVFTAVKEVFPNKTFLDPNENDWMNYMAEGEDKIVVKAMISESPTENYHGIRIPRLEKTLVDLYCDKLWHALFASEMNNLYIESCSNFALNFSTLLSYAARRGKRSEIWNFIKALEVLDAKTIELIEK